MEHLPRTLSDHASVLLELLLLHTAQSAFTWHLPPRALHDPLLKADIQNEILNFFAINERSVGSPGVLWEAFKAYIRGICVAKQLRLLQDKRARLAWLEADIRTLESIFYEHGRSERLAQIRQKLGDYNETAESEVYYLYAESTMRRYGEYNRAGRTLALMTRALAADACIMELTDVQGSIACSTVDITEAMVAFIPIYIV